MGETQLGLAGAVSDGIAGRDGGPRPRRSFLRRMVTAAAVVPAACAAVGAPRGARAAAGNPNYLPSLYPGENLREFQAIQRHENDHVAFLVKALGSNARPMPTFQNLAQPNLVTFAQTTRALENTGVGAYLGALPYINSHTIAGDAGSIALVEARHAGYANVLLNELMTINVYGEEESFDLPLTPAQVQQLAGPFIASLNGGPPLTYSTTPSDANDIMILNFALGLEYLEAAFYNLNVPRFS